MEKINVKLVTPPNPPKPKTRMLKTPLIRRSTNILTFSGSRYISEKVNFPNKRQQNQRKLLPKVDFGFKTNLCLFECVKYSGGGKNTT